MKNNEISRVIYTTELAENYEKNRSENEGDKYFWEKEKQEIIFAMNFSGLRIHSLLEAGCGTGRFLPDFIEKGYDVLGLDFSPYMLQVAKRKVVAKQPNCSLIRADIRHIPISSKQLDFIYSIRVMNQLPSRSYAIDGIKELIKTSKSPSGILIEYVNTWSISRLSFKKSTHLSIKDIMSILKEKETRHKLVYVRGILFFSQTLWNKIPSLLFSPFVRIDSFMCRKFPIFSTRCYVLIMKK